MEDIIVFLTQKSFHLVGGFLVTNYLVPNNLETNNLVNNNLETRQYYYYYDLFVEHIKLVQILD